jgi:hypothetical protein
MRLPNQSVQPIGAYRPFGNGGNAGVTSAISPSGVPCAACDIGYQICKDQGGGIACDIAYAICKNNCS